MQHSEKPKDKDELVARKPKVYTPYGMYVAFKQLSKPLEIKNRHSTTKSLAAAGHALHDGREERKQPRIAVHPMDEPARQKLDYSSLQRELKFIDRFIAALKELNAHQPSPNEDGYDNFIMRYNKFSGGINHHLNGMKRAAHELENNTELLESIEARRQPAFTKSMSQPSSTLPETHQSILAIAKEIEATNNPDIAKKLYTQLTNKLSSEQLDINAQDNEGNTLTHKAVELGYKSLVKAIMQNPDRQPNLTIENNDEMTPLKLATQMRNDETQRWRNYLENNQRSDTTTNIKAQQQIHDLLNPKERRDNINTKRLTATENLKDNRKANITDLFMRYINNFTSINKNAGGIGLDNIPYVAVNKNYSRHNASRRERLSPHSFTKTEPSKALNPLIAVNTALTFANIGVRVLIDKICNKIADVGPRQESSTPVATVLKAIFTIPISAAEVIIGGTGELISLGISKLTGSGKAKQTSTTTKEAKDANSMELEPLEDKPRNSTQLIFKSTNVDAKTIDKVSSHENVEVAAATPLATTPRPSTTKEERPISHDDSADHRFKPR